MAGAKGRSGGARRGAGRPRKEPTPPEPLPDMDARELVREISLGRIDPTDKQLKAALALMGDDTKRVLSAGKKDAKNEAAKAAASKFGAAPPPPRMVVNNGR